MNDNWRPEFTLKETAYNLLDIIFDPRATPKDCKRAAITLIEIVQPQILEELNKNLQEEWQMDQNEH